MTQEDPPNADLVIEMVQGDVLPESESAAVSSRLSSAIGSDARVVLGLSALEPHGQQWWIALYLWLMSSRARDLREVLLDATVEWAVDYRTREPRGRPVYVQAVGPDGWPGESILVRGSVRRRKASGQRPRPRPRM